jgi:hypothetical protein
MKFLAQQPSDRWSRPHASPLKNHSYVIRFKDENGAQHRMFGFFARQHHTFVICFAGHEKDNKYHPPDYEARVAKCKSLVELDFKKRTTDCDW